MQHLNKLKKDFIQNTILKLCKCVLQFSKDIFARLLITSSSSYLNSVYWKCSFEQKT